MGDDITIGVTEIVNNIEVTAQPNDQIIDVSVIDNSDSVTLNVTPTVIEVNIERGGSFARWGTIYGNILDQVDLTNALFNKADLISGKVPASQLPSFVDDVIEVANFAALPTVGETGKIYLTLDNNKIYRWSGSIYIEIASNQAIWGAITGTLANQTDLVNALNLRVPYTGATSDVNLGNFDIYASKYYMLDAVNNNYGSLHFTDSNFHIEDSNGDNLFVVENGYLQIHKTNNIQSNLYTTNLTAIRDHYLPDASGTLVLTSQLHNSVTIGTANGLSLSGQVLSLGLAGAAATGALSNTDWNTFNNKQGVITLTTNGTSGVSTLVGTTLNIPNYTTDISGLVPYTGATQDVNLGVHTLLAQDLVINHSNGSGVAASITKNGSGEALTVIKGSGSGRAASITGGVTLISELNTTTGISDTYIASAAIWNAKQNALNGTGFVKISGTTISYDNSDYVPTSRTITINGVTQDLTANRSFSINALPSMFEFNETDKTMWNNGKANIASNTSYGDGALIGSSAGTDNTAIGYRALFSNSFFAAGNTAIGSLALTANTSGNTNTAVGNNALVSNSTGSNNISIGQQSGQTYQNISTSIFIGNQTSALGENQTNQIVIGHGAVGNGTNSVTLGNTSITRTFLRGDVLIGVTAGVRTLTVNNSTGFYSGAFSGGTSGNYVGLGVNTLVPTIQGFLSGNSVANLSLQPDGGNVGIGILSPAQRLDVNGSINISPNFFFRYDGEVATMGSGTSTFTGNANDFAIRTQNNLIFATGGPSERMRISTSGNVVIANLGTGLVYSNAGTLTSTNPSDSRLKDDITDIEYGLNEILQLRPVSYNWKNDTINQGKQFGFIAQEVQEVMPELISEFTTIEDEEEVVRLGLDKEGIYATLVNAIKEQQMQIDLLKLQIEMLKQN